MGASLNINNYGWSLKSRAQAGAVPLYHTEEMLWTNQRLYPRAGTYHVPFGLDIEGPVNEAALQEAIDRMVARHDAFRTTFPAVQGQPSRQAHAALAVKLHKVEVADAAGRRSAILSHCQEPFDLQTGPLWRVALISGGAPQDLLLVVVHHIVFDEASISLFVEDFAAQYDAALRDAPAGEAPQQFADYVKAKYARRSASEFVENNGYWAGKISGMERLIELPFYRCPNDERRFRGGSLKTRVHPEAAQHLADFCVHTGTRRQHVMTAGLMALLYRYFGSTDNTVLTLVDDRQATGYERVIGFGGNVLPLRSVLAQGLTFKQLSQMVGRLAAEAFEHREIPLNDIVQIVRGEEGHVTEAPFHVMFEERARPRTFQAGDGVRFTQAEVDNGLAKMPLSLTLVEHGDRLELTWDFNKHVFDDVTIGEFAHQYDILLGQLCARPGDVLENFDLDIRPRPVAGNRPVYTPHAFEPFPREEIEQSIIDRFEAQAARRPNKTAVSTQSRTYSYRELSEGSHRLARHLLDRFGTDPRRYALCFEHDASFVAAVLGVLKAVGAYVPLDLTFPKERLQYVLEDAGITAIIGNTATASICGELSEQTGLPFVNLDDVDKDATPPAALPVKPGKGDLAYILYTSGSTGKPKGVKQIHRNVLHHMRMWTNTMRITEHDHHSLFSAYPWDSSVQDMFGTLLNGATLYPLNVKESNLGNLPKWLGDHGISVIHITIPLFRRIMKLVGADEVLHTVRAVAAGGDAMHKMDLELFKAHFPRQSCLVNMYGATESSSALCFVAGQDTAVEGEVVPLGFPAEENTVVLIRNGVEQRAHSIVGEIAIKSEFTSPGYWNADSEMQKRFIPDPHQPGRYVYMTGDLGRVLHDGSIEHVGRTDFQVKIRGFRVGLGEVEAVVAEHAAVKDVVVIADDGLGEEKELVVYYALHEVAEKPTSRQLREYMLTRVPDYMVPRYFIDVGALPLTSRGKIDRQALPKPQPEVEKDTGSASADEARTSVEKALKEIWEDVLQIKPVGIRDNFFMLGGHSMLGFEMFDRVEQRFGVTLAPVTLYRGAATVELLALAIEKERNRLDAVAA